MSDFYTITNTLYSEVMYILPNLSSNTTITTTTQNNFHTLLLFLQKIKCEEKKKVLFYIFTKMF